jgi:acyl dehydratase
VSAGERTTLCSVGELRERVGTRLGASSWRFIDQPTVDRFAELTGDRQWIHVDPVRAALGPFARTIAHGFLTLSLCAWAIDEALAVEGAGLQVNYGLDRVRFPAPVPTGSSLRGVVELVSVADVDGGVEAVLRVTFEIEGTAKPGCVADVVIRFITS